MGTLAYYSEEKRGSEERFRGYVFAHFDFGPDRNGCDAEATKSLFLDKLPLELHQSIREAAHWEGTSVRTWVVEAIEMRLHALRARPKTDRSLALVS
jgi:hypothetical protein